MKDNNKEISLIIISLIYGGLLGFVICPILFPSLQSLPLNKFFVFFVFGSVGGLLAITYSIECNLINNIGEILRRFLTYLSGVSAFLSIVSLLNVYEFYNLTKVINPICSCLVFGWGLSRLLSIIAKRQNTNPELIIDGHIVWIFSLLNRFTYLLFENSVDKSIATSKINKKTWDISLIIMLTQELTEVFPKEWDDWQPEIECMMAFRKIQQSNGVNHRLISLITFYHLSLFVWHIGINKVFILATRRTTR